VRKLSAFAFGLLFCVCAVVSAAGQESSSVTVAMEFGVANCAFRLDQIKTSPGVVFSRRGDAWLGNEKCHTTLVTMRPTGREWEEMWVEFVPAGDGPVNLSFYGDLHYSMFPGDAPVVWIDDVQVEGATLTNGDFEAATTNGIPRGWQMNGQFGAARYSRDGAVAHSGKACVAVSWAGGEAVQTLMVSKGKPCRVRVWHRMFDPRHPAVPRVPFAFPAPLYRQEFEVVLRSAEAAAQAQVSLAPLFNDAAWAVSSRWDDNNGEDIKMRDVLAKHGQHGTFYLNGITPDWSKIPPSISSDTFGREIIKNDNSIGGHSLTHPWLSYCNRNRIFEETAGVRIQWEAAVDMPVLSYAFSYCNCWNFVERYGVQADITRLLERGGYYNIASESGVEMLQADMILSPILPGDAQEIDWFVNAALASPWYREQHPNLSYSMHVYYSRISNGWERFEADLDRYGHGPDWWYCNENKYAAYRYQFQFGRLAQPARRGNVLKCRLDRPMLLDLNDAIPLTMRVAGVKPEDVEAVRCATAECAPADRKTDVYAFSLSHNRDQALPVKIGLVPPNVDNRAVLKDGDQDTDFPGVRALLHFHNGKLVLILDNQGPEPLTQVRVTYRLPLAWKDGIVRKGIADVPAQGRRETRFAPAPLHADYKYNSGTSFFVAQIDFRQGTTPGRLHTACLVANPKRDPSYPQGGFLKLGPILQRFADATNVAEAIRAGTLQLQPWVLPDDSRVEWRLDDPRDIRNDPELVAVPPGGEGPQFYILRSDLVSAKAQTVQLPAVTHLALAICLNGEIIKGQQALQLRAGTNQLWLIHYASDTAFLRVLKLGSVERVTNIRFEPPAGDPSAAPYVLPSTEPVKQKTIAGKWRAKLIRKLAPAPNVNTPHLDTGISAEARQSVTADFDDHGWPEVQVPAQWATYGGDWANSNGEAVFRRTVNVPAEWAGKDLTLSLGPVDDFDDTFFNGAPVGRTDKAVPDFYRVPRRYKVPGALVKAGPNVVAVRVFDHFGGGGITGQPLDLFVAPTE
jgi:hypothetical protein